MSPLTKFTYNQKIVRHPAVRTCSRIVSVMIGSAVDSAAVACTILSVERCSGDSVSVIVLVMDSFSVLGHYDGVHRRIHQPSSL